MKDAFSCKQLRTAALPYFAVAVSCLFFWSCSEEADWEEALNQTAPAPPLSIAEKKEPAKKPKIVTAAEREEEKAEAIAVSRLATFNFRLADFPTCANGAVRLYLNGKYKAAFDDQGLLNLEVAPGSYKIEVWDSGGRWQANRDIRENQSLEVIFTCSAKIAANADQ
jgi:hypothetical protein